MDKTIEVVLVAVVLITTAAIMLYIVTGEASDFSDFLSDRTGTAEEDLDQAQQNLYQEEPEDGFPSPVTDESFEDTSLTPIEYCRPEEYNVLNGDVATEPSGDGQGWNHIGLDDEALYTDDGSLVFNGTKYPDQSPQIYWEYLPEENKDIAINMEFLQRGKVDLRLQHYSVIGGTNTCYLSSLSEMRATAEEKDEDGKNIYNSFTIYNGRLDTDDIDLELEFEPEEEINIDINKDEDSLIWEINGEKNNVNFPEQYKLDDFIRLEFKFWRETDVRPFPEAKINKVEITDKGEDNLSCSELGQKACTGSDQCENLYDIADPDEEGVSNYQGCVPRGEGGESE